MSFKSNRLRIQEKNSWWQFVTGLYKKMNYIKQKRKQEDYCSICGEYAVLTWDHVPPKCIKIGDGAYANTLFSGDLPDDTVHMKNFQNGVKYRNICSRCNNSVLGKYDKDYAEFVRRVENGLILLTRALDSEKELREQDAFLIIENVAINKALRAITGHFLAMKDSYDVKSRTDCMLREFLLDETKILEEIGVYAWFYPYRTIVNVRDFFVGGASNFHPKGCVSVMSSYPLAYLLSTNDETECGIEPLNIYLTANINDMTTIKLHLSSAFYPYVERKRNSDSLRRRSFMWPMNLDEDCFGAQMILGNEVMANGIVAMQSRIKQ